MKPLAEEQRITTTVADVRVANTAADEEDGVLAQSAGRYRPGPGVTVVTAHPIRPETPGWEGKICVVFREFPHGVRQPIRRAQQDLDDLGLRGIPSPGDVVAVIVEVPL